MYVATVITSTVAFAYSKLTAIDDDLSSNAPSAADHRSRMNHGRRRMESAANGTGHVLKDELDLASLSHDYFSASSIFVCCTRRLGRRVQRFWMIFDLANS